MTVAINHTTPSDGSFSATGATAWDAAHAISGTVPIANGGTNGTAAPTAGAVPYGDGTSYKFTAAGTLGQVLTSAGVGVPTWATPATGSPGGSTTQIQYNNAGAFAGSAALTFDGTTLAATNVGIGTTTPTVPLEVIGNVNLGSQLATTGGSATLKLRSGANKYFAITSDDTGVAFQAYSSTPLTFQSGGGGGITFGTLATFSGGISDLGTPVNFGGGASGGAGAMVYTKDATNGASIQTYGSKPLYINSGGNGMTLASGNFLVSSGNVTITGAFALRGSYGGGGVTSNFAAGDNALLNNSTGANNTAVGNSALTTTTTSNANTAVGYQALNLSTGTTNAAFGANSGSAITSGTYNVVIGGYTGAAAPISATGNNYVVLSDGQANVRAHFDSTGVMTVPTYTAGVSVFSSAGVVSSVAPSTTGNVLTSNGTTWVSSPAGSGSGTVTSVGFTGGIITVATPTTTPAFTVAGTSGGIPYFSSASTWATSAVLAANALVVGGGAGVAPATVTTGTGALTALGIAVGSAGAFVTNGGALGTPSSGVATNLTGTASGLTAGNVTTNANLTGSVTSVGNATTVVTNANLTGMVTSVGNAAVLGSFTSANLATALTDETGSGAAVFATSPTLVTPVLGTPSSGTLTSCTSLPISTGVSGLGTNVATALAVNTGSAGAFAVNNSANTFSATNTFYQVNYTVNTVTVSANAGTVPITYRMNNFTNSSAAAMAVTMTTTSAVDGQMSIVRIYDFSAAAQVISWVNTENSTVSAPLLSNGSTTLPLTVGFMYNSQTSKWRCIASA